MRIDELLGIKSTNIKPKPNDGALSRKGRVNDFIKQLREKGFESLGGGAYGAAVGHPNIDYVIKIFDRDPGYMAFLKFALANQSNPYLPKFRGKVMAVGDGFYAVRMEKLTSVSIHDADYQAMARIAFYIEDDKGFPTSLTEKYDEMITAMIQIDDARAAVPGILWDMHDGNVMRRPDGHIVVIDPFAD